MNGIHFAQPWFLVGSALAPLVFLGWAIGARSARLRAQSLSRTLLSRPPYAAGGLLAVAAGLAFIGAARPQWGSEPRELPLRGADLVVVLDVSRSMDAQDVPPSRIAAARATIGRAFAAVEGDRVALVIFAGDAAVRFPLTTDVGAAIRVLDTVETGQLFVEGGSAAAAALDVAATVFDADRDAGRLVLLLTDGDDLGADPSGSATRLADAGVALLVAGVGTPEGSTIPVVNRQGEIADKLDANGAPIVTRLNEPFLRSIASTARGRYLGTDLGAVPGAVVSRLDALKQGQFDQRTTDVPGDRFPLFIAAALFALTLAVIAENLRLSLHRSSRAAAAAAAFALVLLAASCAESAYLANEDGIEALERGHPQDAVERFTEAQAASPGDLQVSLNLAAALHADGKYDEAARVARRATRSPDLALRASAYASIGHHVFAAGDLTASLDAFRQALLIRPSDDTYRHDYEVVLRLLTPPADDTEPGDGGQQSPGDDGQPGNDQQPAGDGEPGSGNDDSQPGEGAQPGAGGSDGQPANGGPGAAPGGPATREEVEAELERINREIAELLWEEGEEPTITQALEILELLEEHSRLAALRETVGRSSDPNDY